MLFTHDMQIVSVRIEGTSTVELTLAQYWSTQGHTALDVQVTWRFVLLNYFSNLLSWCKRVRNACEVFDSTCACVRHTLCLFMSKSLQFQH